MDDTHSNLDNIRRNQIHVLEAPENGPELARGPPARLRRPGGRRERRVQRVDVERQVDRPLRPDAVDDPLDDALGADGVDLARLDDLEPAVPVVRVVAGPAERRPDARVDVRVVCEKTLARCVVEVCPVIYARYLGRRAAEDFGSPFCAAKLG